jgi:hypothetical protein
VTEGFCRYFFTGVPLRYISTGAHLKHNALVLKFSNALSLVITKIFGGGEQSSILPL